MQHKLELSRNKKIALTIFFGMILVCAFLFIDFRSHRQFFKDVYGFEIPKEARNIESVDRSRTGTLSFKLPKEKWKELDIEKYGYPSWKQVVDGQFYIFKNLEIEGTSTNHIYFSINEKKYLFYDEDHEVFLCTNIVRWTKFLGPFSPF